MTYAFRNAIPEDFDKLLKNSTENGKVDNEVIRDSVEIKVMTCDDEPIIKKHTKQAIRFCKDLIFDRIGFRFLVLIDENNKKFVRFVEFFGFKRTNFVEEKLGTLYHLYIKDT